MGSVDSSDFSHVSMPCTSKPALKKQITFDLEIRFKESELITSGCCFHGLSASTGPLTLARKPWTSLKRLRSQSLGQGSGLLEMSPRVKNKKVGKIYYRDFHFRGDVVSHHRYTRASIKPDKLELNETFQRRRHSDPCPLLQVSFCMNLK